jgi:hypothetical protein
VRALLINSLSLSLSLSLTHTHTPASYKSGAGGNEGARSPADGDWSVYCSLLEVYKRTYLPIRVLGVPVCDSSSRVEKDGESLLGALSKENNTHSTLFVCARTVVQFSRRRLTMRTRCLCVKI